MLYADAYKTANTIRASLAPHCDRIEIAGSIRRKCEKCNDVEIICIPKDRAGVSKICNEWTKIKGDLLIGRYTRREVCINGVGTFVDIFTATHTNWGLIYAMRTGNTSFSHKILASGWVKHGYHSISGMLHNGRNFVLTPEERDVFKIAGVEWTEPEERDDLTYITTWGDM